MAILIRSERGRYDAPVGFLLHRPHPLRLLYHEASYLLGRAAPFDNQMPHEFDSFVMDQCLPQHLPTFPL